MLVSNWDSPVYPDPPWNIGIFWTALEAGQRAVDDCRTKCHPLARGLRDTLLLSSPFLAPSSRADRPPSCPF
jgi:hypothetical protein